MVRLLKSISTTRYVVLIVLVGLVVYLNSFNNGFVMDDSLQIVDNPLIRSVKNIPITFLTSTFNAGSTIQGAYYRPLMMSAFTIIYALFGADSAFMYHAILIILHIVNAVLIFFVFKHFFKKPIAFLSALLFLVHPINAETANYVSNMQETLFVFFGLLAVKTIMKGSKRSVFLSLFLILLSLFSKETGVLFIFTVFMYQVFFHRKYLALYSVGAIVVAGIYAALHTVAVGWTIKGESPISQAPLEIRLLNVPHVIWYYLKTLVFPKSLATGYSQVIPSATWSEVYLPLLTIVATFGSLGIIGYLLYRRKDKQLHRYLFFLSMFGAGIALHSQLVPLDQTVADRWFYFPFIGLLGLLATGLSRITYSKKYLSVYIIGALLILVMLGTRTIIRNNDWKDGKTLAEHDLVVNPNSYLLTNYYGYELSKEGYLDEAKDQYEASIKYYPEWGISWNNLGSVLVKTSKESNDAASVERARYALQEAARYLSVSDIPYENMAILMYEHDKPEATREYVKKMLKKFPRNSRLWLILSFTEYKMKNETSAKQAAEKSLKLNPSCSDCINILRQLN